ncbi:multiple cyclophane-containing RiPP AmcA [Lentzea sp. E54]|uniref:multiple cyclophane-containing RiPP AmcA n=1 Tax=Lentzea xerophila TaxID=3435883 RepID=UPI003DA47F8A
MTVLEHMVRTVSNRDTEWAQFVAANTTKSVNASGVDWGRKMAGGPGARKDRTKPSDHLVIANVFITRAPTLLPFAQTLGHPEPLRGT